MKIPNNMISHIEKIFKGEYDIAYENKNPVILDSGGNRIGEDFLLIQRLAAHNRLIKHHPEITWIYHDDRQSTLGMPSRW